ncbi:MAG: CPBP family intramembrane glutamic endopeptidase, partial [Pseudomonadota bacterium]
MKPVIFILTAILVAALVATSMLRAGMWPENIQLMLGDSARLIYIAVVMGAGVLLARFGAPIGRWGFESGLRLSHLLLALVGVAIIQGFEHFGLPLFSNLLEAGSPASEYSDLEGNLQLFLTLLLLSWTFAAFGEEIAYRVVLMRGLQASFGGTTSAAIIALLIQAVIFGFAHYYNGGQMAVLRTGFNALVAISFFDPDWYLDYMNLAQTYGLGVIGRLGNVFSRQWSFPGSGELYDPIYTSSIPKFFLLGDEPDDDQSDLNDIENEYAHVLNSSFGYPSLLLSTAVTSERLDDPTLIDGTVPVDEFQSGEDTDGAEQFFQQVNPPINRFMRYYPIRKSFDLVNKSDVLDLQPAAAMKVFETSYQLPWWYVPQAGGNGLSLDNENFWRFPT